MSDFFVSPQPKKSIIASQICLSGNPILSSDRLGFRRDPHSLRNGFYIIIFLLSLFGSAMCSASEICPASIATEQRAAIAPKNYQIIESPDSPTNLWMIWFSDRNPMFNAWVRASQASNKMEVWNFRQLEPKHEIWVSCFYTDTDLTLVQKLPSSLSSCVVHFFDAKHDQIEGMPTIKSVNCQ